MSEGRENLFTMPSRGGEKPPLWWIKIGFCNPFMITLTQNNNITVVRLRHSSFLHQTTFGDSIRVYVKMLEGCD